VLSHEYIIYRYICQVIYNENTWIFLATLASRSYKIIILCGFEFPLLPKLAHLERLFPKVATTHHVFVASTSCPLGGP
jgi:hypothetical protein